MIWSLLHFLFLVKVSFNISRKQDMCVPYIPEDKTHLVEVKESKCAEKCLPGDELEPGGAGDAGVVDVGQLPVLKLVAKPVEQFEALDEVVDGHQRQRGPVETRAQNCATWNEKQLI